MGPFRGRFVTVPLRVSVNAMTNAFIPNSQRLEDFHGRHVSLQ
jgi:hypothetical protein